MLGNKNNVVLCMAPSSLEPALGQSTQRKEDAIFYDFRSLIKHRHVDMHKQ